MENSYFTAAFLLHIDESELEEKASWDYRFENQGIETTNILMNCADIFFGIILAFLFMTIMVAISVICHKIPEKVCILQLSL